MIRNKKSKELTTTLIFIIGSKLKFTKGIFQHSEIFARLRESHGRPTTELYVDIFLKEKYLNH